MLDVYVSLSVQICEWRLSFGHNRSFVRQWKMLFYYSSIYNSIAVFHWKTALRFKHWRTINGFGYGFVQNVERFHFAINSPYLRCKIEEH